MGKNHTKKEKEYYRDMLLGIIANADQEQGMTQTEVSNYIFDKHDSLDYSDFIDGRKKSAVDKEVARILEDMTQSFGYLIRGENKRYKLNPLHPPFNLLSAARSQMGARLMPPNLYQAIEETSKDVSVAACQSQEMDVEGEFDDVAFNAEWEFERKNLLIQQLENTPFCQWLNKFKLINHNSFGFNDYQHVRYDIYRIICEALLKEKKVKITYSSTASDSEKSFNFSPLGLIIFGAKTYLVGKYGGEQINDVRRLLVSRISEIQLTDCPVSDKCKYFNLDAYVDGGFFEFSDSTYNLVDNTKNKRPSWETVSLKCASDCTFDKILEVLRMPTDIDPTNNIINFEAYISPELENWLMMETPGVKVLSPEHLRVRLANRLANACKLYNG